MKAKVLFLVLLASVVISCNSDNSQDLNPVNAVLMLQVDYTTHTFEGGKEFNFPEQTGTFTITNEYVSPGDFGSIKLFYSELNETLFYGTIIWMGSGKILYPEKWSSADDFKKALEKNLVYRQVVLKTS
jgi:hypothetical protein